MAKKKIAILDLITKSRSRSMWNRMMQANFASIMPQALAVWCEELGHDVTFVSYTGSEDLQKEIPTDVDFLFVSAFTHAAQLAYAISNASRQHGVITVLGGPHARSYPDDAARYFDYVLGLTTKTLLEDVLRDGSRQRPLGLQLSAREHPPHLPGLRARWKFAESVLAKGLGFEIVPMIGSFGCPYSCEFCTDATIPYQSLGEDQIRDDLRFLLGKRKHPRVGWHDPNFGVRFDQTMDAIEEVVPPGRMEFVAESSLSLLSEPRVRRMKEAGFQALLPGIESWYACADKSRARGLTGREKVERISEHVNMILRYIPYVQTNFVLGLDVDHGSEPFELTKLFLDQTPGAFPAYSLFSAFGRSAPLNAELERAGRVLPIPFHFLDNNRAMNVRLQNYELAQFYDHLIDLRQHSFSWRLVQRRYRANHRFLVRSVNLVRALSSEGHGRIAFDAKVRRLLDTDATVRAFLQEGSTTVPAFYMDQVRRDLGPWWRWLPSGALHHDPGVLSRPAQTTFHAPPPPAPAPVSKRTSRPALVAEALLPPPDSRPDPA